ncbi:hypothetical protein Syun_015321 [Stephania yunnanensis]|uniref:NIF system FeS cluster assembly NifU C-terminal domain-containing protein n=1 Tax=Stephania yunnanensis TaxID=152371 RepID=A0AAP0JM11_9MAGN
MGLDMFIELFVCLFVCLCFGVCGGEGVVKPSCALPLTEENVEKVLDEVRPSLMADGGNVALHEIDGLVCYYL